MGILDLIRPKGVLHVEATVEGLPPRWALIVNALTIRVPSAATPPINDIHRFKSECVKEREAEEVWPLRLALNRSAGFYYVGLSVIAFRTEEYEGKLHAQVERFFPMLSPCELRVRSEQRLVLHVQWPDIPLSELGSYGTIYPNRRSGSGT